MIGVRARFSAAHRDPLQSAAPVHGHSFEVVAWFISGDAVALQRRTERAVSVLDHRLLPVALSRSEAIGAMLMRELGAAGAEVNRPVEGIFVKVGWCG